MILTVTDEAGVPDTGSTTATIDQAPQPPVADVGGSYQATAGVAVVFDGRGSTDPEDGVLTYSWDFGDMSPAGVGATPSHTYSTDGLYVVTLTVTDDTAMTDTDEGAAVIGSGINQPPVADANGPYLGRLNVAVAFDGRGSIDPEGGVLTYDWVFGDGGVGTGATPTHVYTVAGLYVVTLTVTDDTGADDSNKAVAFAALGNLPPRARANGPYLGEIGMPVIFDGTASVDPAGSIVTYDWAFGDGGMGSGATPSYTYTANNIYNVILTVTDDAGVTDSDGTAAVIGPRADLEVGDIGVSPDPVTLDSQVTYTIPISNSGPGDEPDAAAIIILPSNATFNTATASQGSCLGLSGAVSCYLGVIVNGGSATVTVSVTAPSAVAVLALTATARGELIDPDLTNNVELSTTVARAADPGANIANEFGGALDPLWLVFLMLLSIGAARRRLDAARLPR